MRIEVYCNGPANNWISILATSVDTKCEHDDDIGRSLNVRMALRTPVKMQNAKSKMRCIDALLHLFAEDYREEGRRERKRHGRGTGGKGGVR